MAKRLGTFRPFGRLPLAREDYAAILFGFGMPQMLVDLTIDAFRRGRKRFAGAVKAV